MGYVCGLRGRGGRGAQHAGLQMLRLLSHPCCPHLCCARFGVAAPLCPPCTPLLLAVRVPLVLVLVLVASWVALRCADVWWCVPCVRTTVCVCALPTTVCVCPVCAPLSVCVPCVRPRPRSRASSRCGVTSWPHTHRCNPHPTCHACMPASPHVQLHARMATCLTACPHCMLTAAP